MYTLLHLPIMYYYYYLYLRPNLSSKDKTGNLLFTFISIVMRLCVRFFLFACFVISMSVYIEKDVVISFLL